MEIKKESDQTVEIFMSSDDLLLFGLTYHQINYDNCLTKLMINELMSFCRSFFSKGHTSKVLTEVFPASGGGCVIYFTALKNTGRRAQNEECFIPKKYRVKRQEDFVVFRFENSDDLIRGMTAAKKSFRQKINSELFLFENRYYLLVKERLSQRQKDILCEFAKREGNPALMEPMLKEHGRSISSPF